MARDNAYVHVMGKQTKRIARKYVTIRKYQDKIMANYKKGRIALHVYMQSMGGFHIQKEARTTSDLDPDPFGDGVPSTYEHNSEHTIDDDADDDTAAEDDIYIADGLDLDDDINVPVNIEHVCCPNLSCVRVEVYKEYEKETMYTQEILPC